MIMMFAGLEGLVKALRPARCGCIILQMLSEKQIPK